MSQGGTVGVSVTVQVESFAHKGILYFHKVGGNLEGKSIEQKATAPVWSVQRDTIVVLYPLLLRPLGMAVVQIRPHTTL